MADAGVELHLLQRVAGHQDPAVTAGYLHPDMRAVLEAGAAFSQWWSQTGPTKPTLGGITAAVTEHETGPDLPEQIRAHRSG